MVSRVGLEPTTRCLRGSCSTIELPAHKSEIVTRALRATQTRVEIENRARNLLWQRVSALFRGCFWRGAKRGCDLSRDLARSYDVAGSKGNCRNAGVSATAVFLAEARQIHFRRNIFPWTRPYGHLRADGDALSPTE